MSSPARRGHGREPIRPTGFPLGTAASVPATAKQTLELAHEPQIRQ